MSVIKAFAHRAHHALAPLAPDTFRRSHVYELLAAGLGFKSWAALHTAHVLVDDESTQSPPDFDRNVLARALQLGLSQPAAEAVTDAFKAQYADQPFGCFALSELDESLFPPRPQLDDEPEWDDSDLDDDEDGSDGQERGQPKRPIPKLSRVLLDDLADRASRGEAFSHYRLAKLLECKAPNDYLYQESLRGRVLNSQEKIWVEEYFRLRVQHAEYLKHLACAADGNIRAAALDYSLVTGKAEYRHRAEKMGGDADPQLMADSASDWPTRRAWLWKLVDLGHPTALEQLAREGDQDAANKQLALEMAQAIAGDLGLIRGLAYDALRDGDAVGAWKWYFVALHHDVDLTQSTMRAYHEGGVRDGQLYNSDFGGSMYADGDEGLELPNISRKQKSLAKAMARQLLSDAVD